MLTDTSATHPFLSSSGETAIAWIFAGSAALTLAVLVVAWWRRRSAREDRGDGAG